MKKREQWSEYREQPTIIEDYFSAKGVIAKQRNESSFSLTEDDGEEDYFLKELGDDENYGKSRAKSENDVTERFIKNNTKNRAESAPETTITVLRVKGLPPARIHKNTK